MPYNERFMLFVLFLVVVHRACQQL